jgi:hypothetical protein
VSERPSGITIPLGPKSPSPTVPPSKSPPTPTR